MKRLFNKTVFILRPVVSSYKHEIIGSPLNGFEQNNILSNQSGSRTI